MESNLTVHHLNTDLGYRSTKDLLVNPNVKKNLLVNQVMTHEGVITRSYTNCVVCAPIVACISR